MSVDIKKYRTLLIGKIENVVSLVQLDTTGIVQFVIVIISKKNLQRKTMNPSELRREFEKAFESGEFSKNHTFGSIRKLDGKYSYSGKIALWAAQWAFSKAAEEADNIGQSPNLSDSFIGNKLRHLSQELSGGGEK